MYIACKKCNTNFIVSPELIGLSGRRVRCSKCKHVWHAEATQSSIEDDVLTPQTELFKPLDGGVHLPALIIPEVKKNSFDRLIILGIFLIFSFALFFSQYMNFDYSKKVEYEFKIGDLKANYGSEKNKIILHYSISNSSNKDLNISDIKINFYDKFHHMIKVVYMQASEIALKPHQNLKFKTELLDIPLDIEFVEVATESDLESLFKKIISKFYSN